MVIVDRGRIELLRSAITKKRLLAVARGCHDYGGGYHDGDKSEIYHHGIQTVITALEACVRNPNDTQVAGWEEGGRSA